MPAPERALGWLLLVAVGAVLGAPVAALAATTATSALSVGLRVAFRRLATWARRGLLELAGQAGRCLRGCA